MKTNDYIKAVESVKVQKNTKDEIWQNVLNQEEKAAPKNRRFSVKRCAAIATAAACVAVFASPLISSGIESLMRKMYPQSEKIAEKIETSVFEDNDGHVKMTVEEMLSDMQSVYMIVHYEALDETGKEWLANRDFTRPFISDDTGAYFDFGLGVRLEEERSGSFGNSEIEENRTENERWFYVTCESQHVNNENKRGAFGYYMTDGAKSTWLDIGTNVETYVYELTSDESPSDRFTPKYLTVSELSFTVFAENISVYTRYVENGIYHEESLLSIEEIIEIEESVCFVMADGEKIPVAINGAMGSLEPDESNYYCDLLLFDGTHVYFNEETQSYEHRTIDAENIVGLEIMGVYYDLK